MIFIWNIQSVIIGFLFGTGLAIGFFTIAEDLLLDMRQDDPNEEFINSEYFTYFMKVGVPIMMIIVGSLALGPLFRGFYEQFVIQEKILGLEAGLAYVIIILLISLILDAAVFITKTPFPTVKLLLNTWTFLSLGLLLHLSSI